jgi:hypothetical protein
MEEGLNMTPIEAKKTNGHLFALLAPPQRHSWITARVLKSGTKLLDLPPGIQPVVTCTKKIY